jgi:hypothetical protein
MELGPRKFFKFFSLSFVFKYREIHDDTLGDIAVYDTSESGFNPDFVTEYISSNRVNKHTIMFITVNSDDEQLSTQGHDRYIEIITKTPSGEGDENIIERQYRKVHAGDTMIWARGNLYCVSTKTVVDVDFDSTEKKFIFTYNDGTDEKIDISLTAYTGIFPIKVNENNIIELENIYYDENHNLVINSDSNATNSLGSISFAHVEGVGNQARADYQHIEGKYALVEDGRYIFVIGNGTSGSPLNVFTVTFDGVAHLKTDVTAGGTPDNPDFKLSDIHSVLDVDWYFVGDRYADYNARDYTDETYLAM